MRAAVLGSPIAHSLSPVLHLAAYRALGLADWDYEKHLCTEPKLAGFDGGGRAVVLGAGGTAQAALPALCELGIEEIEVLVRSLGRTEELQATADRIGVAPTISDALVDPERASAALADADVVISTLPGAAADPLRGAGPKTVLLDVIYAPWPTPFAAAAAAGARVCSGLEVLLQQAAGQVELMTGCPGPVSQMRAALDAAVAARG